MCSTCGTMHDRDLNASINLNVEGIRILKEEKHSTIIHDDKATAGMAENQAFQDDVRPIAILQNACRRFSMKKEVHIYGKDLHESPSFRKE
ncbi:MAG: hypothetical protein BAJALOKI1v1_1650005 [Promethearchaeota archaeon]|nr:MAG: hypothetical protein BAJALOKI1v1_1650005 [Candidatus Lokiarchaeota archaeon]